VIVVLDLDDTLYPEITFVHSGFRAVAADLADRFGIDEQAAFDAMLAELDAHGRGAVFDVVLAAHDLASPAEVQTCVEIYRGHRPTIALADGAAAVLDALTGHPLYLVTDGDPGVQARKVEALGIEHRFHGIYRTWAFGPEFAKPSLRCFEDICRREEEPLTSLCYVADDPSKDFVNLRRAGAVTVRVMTGRHRDAAAPPGYDAAIRIPDIGSLDLDLLESSGLGAEPAPSPTTTDHTDITS
jgi:putative hydrolase of the HAD superfamily